MSMGKLTISLMFSLMKFAASPISRSIFRKSADIKIEMQFFISRFGGLKFIGPAKSLFYPFGAVFSI